MFLSRKLNAGVFEGEKGDRGKLYANCIQLESGAGERVLGVWVDGKLNTSHGVPW